MKRQTLTILMLFVAVVAAGVAGGETTRAASPGYHSYDSLVSQLKNLANDHPSIARVEDLTPKTDEGRTVSAIKISDNVGTDESENRVLFVGAHHAREWISVEVPFLLAKYLVESYGTDNSVTSMIDNEEIWIVPVLNPDGYEFSRQTDRDWRKNRRANDGFWCWVFDRGRGVDPNRNYGSSSWGRVTEATSDDCANETYFGPSAFSERETQVVRDLMKDDPFNAVVSYHSFSQLILYPWGHKKDRISNDIDWALMRGMARRMEGLIEGVPGAQNYTAQQSSELYMTTGDLTDWSYETYGIPSFTIELRPCYKCRDVGFELPEDQIQPTWNENKPAAQYLIDFFNLGIGSPSESQPAFAGPADRPTKINVIVNGVWRGKAKDEFTVKIGGDVAQVVSAPRLPEATPGETQNAYLLQVQPPTKPANGTYDLEVIVGDASDLERNAVLYGEKRNADVVLVIDRSGSMGGQKITDARNAAKQFVDFMADGDKIGVVSFSTSATVNYGLSTIGGGVKESAKNAIDGIGASGRTSIGVGLQSGGAELVNGGDPLHPWAIVLLSDGLENEPPWVADVLPDIETEGIAVHTVGLGSNADEALLRNIASRTGGTYHYAPSSQDLADVYNSLGATVAGQQILFSSAGTVQQGSTDEKQLPVDSSVSEATFSITWGGSDLDLTLEAPGGVTIDPAVAASDPDIEFVSGATYEFYRIRDPEVGQWVMRTSGVVVEQPGAEEYTARVAALTELFMDIFLEGGTLTDDPVNVSVSLADSQPILGANVTVLVEPPAPGSSSMMTLYDDGNHGDGLASDGVYAGSYGDTSVAGSYRLTAYASGATTVGDAFIREISEATFVDERPDITVNVIAPPDVEAVPGTTLTHVFTVENTGEQDDTYDLIAGPVEVEQWADLATIPDSVTVAAGASAEIPVTVNVPPAEAHPASNLLSLVAVSQSEPSVRDADSVTTSVPHADLFVTIVGPSTAEADSSLEFTVTYGNKGPVEAPNVAIAAEIPTGLGYAEDSMGTSVTPTEGVREWFVESLPPDSAGTFTLKLDASPAAEGQLSTTVGIVSGFSAEGVAAGAPDPDLSNNTSIQETAVPPTAVVTPTPTPTTTPAPAPSPTGVLEEVAGPASLPEMGGEPADGGKSVLPWLAAIAGVVAVTTASGLWFAVQRRRIR